MDPDADRPGTRRGTVAGVATSTTDDLLGLAPAWQAVIAGCLLVVTLLGIRRLAIRGPARVTNGVLVTGVLIVAVTVIGTLAVSCSGPPGGSAQTRSPGR